MRIEAEPMTQNEILADLLLPAHVYLRVKAATKPALLKEIAKRAAPVCGVAEAAIEAALATREALGSTGFGNGIAVPHARLATLSRLFCALAVLDKPVAYEAVDNQPVDLVFLLLSPEGAQGGHLSLLAAASRRLRQPDIAAALRAATSPEAAIAAMVG
jgi:PTS system nitrogen regulatory IIA component